MTISSRTVAVFLTATLVLAGLAVPVGATPVSSGDTIPLYAGQDELVGNVTISDDGTALTVTYRTMAGWAMTETHLAVGDTMADVPTTKQGNPKVGNFAYSESHDPAVTTYTYSIPLSDVSNDGTVVVAAHAVVVQYELLGDGAPAPQWASTVVDHVQGSLENGGAVSADRTDPNATLGAPEGTYASGTFYSLGFVYDATTGDVYAGSNDYAGGAAPPANGYLVVSFDHPVYNAPGDQDIVVSEVTNGRDSYPDERADVYVLHDGQWVAAGFTVSNQDDVAGPGTGAVGIPDGIESVDTIMLVDATDPAIHSGNADGYDVDGIGAAYLLLGDDPVREETAWASGDRFVDRGNWATYVEYTLSD